MRMMECARCGQDIKGMGKRDYRDKYVHAGPCPTPPEREVEPVRTVPVKIRLSIRAFCRQGAHFQCSAVQYEAGDYRAFVCSCDCHYRED